MKIILCFLVRAVKGNPIFTVLIYVLKSEKAEMSNTSEMQMSMVNGQRQW